MKNPFTDKEREVMNKLAEAWNAYVKLEQSHPQHNTDFGSGIRTCQGVIQHKVLQRDYPEIFPTHKQGDLK